MERSSAPVAAAGSLLSNEVLLNTPRWAMYSQAIRGTHLERSISAAVVTTLFNVFNPVLKE